MPRIASLTNQQFTITGGPGLPPDPTYLSLLLNSTNYDEGDTITATLTSANIEDGTTVAYTVNGISASDITSGSLSGNFTINNNSASLSWDLSEDELTEGTDTFVITLGSNDSAGNSTGSLSRSANIRDTSFDPLNVIWLDDNDDAVSIRQIIGGFSLQVNGVFATNPIVPFAIEGRISGATTTVLAITANTGTYLELDDDGNSTSFIIGEELNLIAPTDYVLTPVASSVNEGTTLNIRVDTVNVDNGTVLYWTSSNTTDLVASSGTVTINNNLGVFTIETVADAATEGPETFSLSLRRDSVSGTILAVSDSITINDTSQAATYTIVPAADNVDEGDSLSVTVNTTDVANGTTLYWTVSDIPNDFEPSSGTLTINNNTGSFAVVPTADYVTEGSESFVLSVSTDEAGLDIVAESGAITINDTTITVTLQVATTQAENSSTIQRVYVNGIDRTANDYYWTIDHITSSSADFVSGTDSGSIGADVVFGTNDGMGEWRILADQLTEGTETFRVQIRVGAVDGPVIATSPTVTITDNSISQSATFTTPATAQEGRTITVTISPSGYPTGSQVVFRIVNGTTSAADFTGGSNLYNTGTQQGVINTGFGGSQTITLNIAEGDGTDEPETFQIELLKTDGVTRAGISDTITIIAQVPIPQGEIAFLEPGTYSWTAPADVVEVNAVVVGGGGRGSSNGAPGGGGGGLRWANSIPVTPGETYTIFVGWGASIGLNGGFTVNGQNSWFINTNALRANPGGNGVPSPMTVGAGGTGTSSYGGGGGTGGSGGMGISTSRGGGGGGTGGYAGNGGNAGAASSGTSGNSGSAAASSSGGGGGGAGDNVAQGGGGVGIFGQGSDGAGGVAGTNTPVGNRGSSGGAGLPGRRGVTTATYNRIDMNAGGTIDGDLVTFGNTTGFSDTGINFQGKRFQWLSSTCPADLYLVEEISGGSATGSTWRLNYAPDPAIINSGRFLVYEAPDGGFPGGGGAGGNGSGSSNGGGGHGAVRLVWGEGRSFPSNASAVGVPDFTVSLFNAGSDAYRISGNDRSTIGEITKGLNRPATFQPGDLIAFCVNASGHPTYIKTTPGTGTGNQVTQGTVTGQGTEYGTIYWDTTGVTPGTYYYQCAVHGAMVGQIIIEDNTPPGLPT